MYSHWIGLLSSPLLSSFLHGLYLWEPHQLEKPTQSSVYVEPQLLEDTGKSLGTDNHVAFF